MTIEGAQTAKMHLRGCSVLNKSSFLDFIFSDLKIDLHVAVDFSAFNERAGARGKTAKLHNATVLQNPYAHTLTSLRECLGHLYTDVMLYGFGSQYAGTSRASDCFALTGDIYRPRVGSTDQAIAAYRTAIGKCTPSAPVNVSGIIKHVCDYAEAVKEEGKT
jgi:hypothetical protein